MEHTTVAVDIAKNVFQVAVSYRTGKVSEYHRLTRGNFLNFFAMRRRGTVVMEACGSAHHWAREVQKLGHQPVLLPPHLIRPYVQRNKTDRADARAILEAYRNQDIKPVPIKTMTQHSIAALHRMRSAWMHSRIARINMIRGLLRELGIFIPVGARLVVPTVLELVEDAYSGLPDAIRQSLYEACLEILEYDRRMRLAERQLHALGKQIPTVRRLRTIPGIGPLTSTALVAFVGDFQRFRSGRRFASFIGLTPREYSSGNLRHLGRISKQGDRYLRTLLSHGARSVLWRAKHMEAPDRLHAWGLRLYARRGHNKAVIAIANKLARITWAVWKRETDFHSHPQAA